MCVLFFTINTFLLSCKTHIDPYNILQASAQDASAPSLYIKAGGSVGESYEFSRPNRVMETFLPHVGTRGWVEWMGGGLVLVLVGGTSFGQASKNLHETCCDEDKHKAPTHPVIHPLSLQDARAASGPLIANFAW